MLTCPKCKGERKLQPAPAESVPDGTPGKLGKPQDSEVAEVQPCDGCGGLGMIRDPQLDEMMQHYQAVVVGLANLTQWLNTLMGFFAKQHGWFLGQDDQGRAVMHQSRASKPERPVRPH